MNDRNFVLKNVEILNTMKNFTVTEKSSKKRNDFTPLLRQWPCGQNPSHFVRT